MNDDDKSEHELRLETGLETELLRRRLANQLARPLYWGLAQAVGLDQWNVTPSRFGFEDPEIVVDPDEVIAVLHHILERTPAG